MGVEPETVRALGGQNLAMAFLAGLFWHWDFRSAEPTRYQGSSSKVLAICSEIRDLPGAQISAAD
jgi:hypothetical protein